MIKEKEIQLKNKIKKIIEEIGYMNGIKQDIGKEFLNRSVPAHRAVNVFMNPDYLDTLTESEDDIRFLFLFAFTLNKVLKDKNIDVTEIDVEEYFTQLEFKRWKDYKEEERKDSIYPLVFENVQQIGDRIWQTVLTAQELAELDADNLLLYNFKTQRNPKITIGGVKIDFDKQKTLEIKERILSGVQYPDHIKLNILNNFQEKINYNPKTQVLTIGEGSILNIFDGFHRKVGNSLAIEESDGAIDFMWGIIITNLSEEAAKDYMVQIDKQRPIKKEQIKSWNLNKKENQVISVIADDKISKFKKIMKNQEREIKLNKGLTTKNIIAEAIKENYELDETTDIRALGKWIAEFIDYLMGVYPEEFITNPYEIKENSVINHKKIFYGYIALSAKLYNNDNWKQITKDKMNSIDFNKRNSLWRDLGLLSSRDANKTLRNKLYNLFMEDV